jgi:hypothetical protein
MSGHCAWSLTPNTPVGNYCEAECGSTGPEDTPSVIGSLGPRENQSPQGHNIGVALSMVPDQTHRAIAPIACKRRADSCRFSL